MHNKPRVLVLTGFSASGKSTLTDTLFSEYGFHVMPTDTDRLPSSRDSANEYCYLDKQTIDERHERGDYAWLINAGFSGSRYAVLRSVIDTVLDDSDDRLWVRSLTPQTAKMLRDFGGNKVRTLVLPSPNDSISLKRMLARGDDEAAARSRLQRERNENWEQQLVEVDGVYWTTKTSRQDLVIKALTVMDIILQPTASA